MRRARCFATQTGDFKGGGATFDPRRDRRWSRVAAAVLLAVTCAAPATSGHAALSKDEGQQIYLEHPDWLLPPWTSGGPAAWTMVGPPFSGAVTLIGADGSFAPRNHGPGVSLWLYDLDASQLLGPGPNQWHFQLEDDMLPIVSGAWDGDGLHVATTFFAGWPGGDVTRWFSSPITSDLEQAVTFINVQVTATGGGPRHLSAYLALRPFGVEPDMHPIASVSCDQHTSTLTADGAVVLVGLQPADACGVSSFTLGDLASFATRDRVPTPVSLDDDAQRAEGVLRFTLSPTPQSAARLQFRLPLVTRSPDPETLSQLTVGVFDDERAKVAAAWLPVLQRTILSVPDARVNASFAASQMYLLLNRRGDLPRSGPLAHDAFWVRDAAYIGEALERVGASPRNQATLDALLTTQRPDGSFPAISDTSGPRPVEEWDAPGEAIAAVVTHYRFTHDTAWLNQAYPSLWRATQFLDALRGRTLGEGPETDSLLPANVSAEDLGPASWHHYWDDFWALAGYRNASFAASELGRADDAAQLDARATDLQTTLLNSIDLVRARTGKDLVPNGPEDVLSPAMARGTTPAVWPVRSLSGSSAHDVLVRSFQNYYHALLAPQGGGYLHYQDTLWPYGGLDIAHAMLRLGMLVEAQEILGWTLDHQTFPGTYAWGEAISPRTGGLELGDMPHSWAAAALISLLRDMLLTEGDGFLSVNAGAPDEWFEPGKSVSLRDAPTQYGVASVVMTRADVGSDGVIPDLRIELSGAPPGGWHVRLPGAPRSAVLEDGSAVELVGAELSLGPGSHVLLASY